MALTSVAHLDARAIAAGAGVAIGVCLPVALLAQLVAAGDEEPSNLVFVFFLLILAGFALGGFVAARMQPLAPYSNGALAATAAFVAIQGVALLVQVVQGDDIQMAAVAFNAVAAYGCGLAGAALALWWTARRERTAR